MKTIEFKITGIKPLLFNKFNVENVSNKQKVKTGSAGNDPEEWRSKIICEGKRLYIPGFYMFSCISAGGQYVKEGRGSIQKKLMGCLLIHEEKFFLNRELPKEVSELESDELPRDSSREIYLDVRGVKNPVTKGRNVRYRLALSAGWSTEISLEWDDTVISRDSMKQAIESAGKFVGLCDARVLGNGRFTISDVKIT